MKPPICTPCGEEQDRWLFSKPSQMFPGLGFVTLASAAYDLTPKGVTERRRARHERWRTLVREQMALIAAGCRAARHTKPPAVPAIVQMDLFELIGGPP